MTLTQQALAERLKRSTLWIRNEGDFVTGSNPDGFKETWAAMHRGSGRLAGYRLVTTERHRHQIYPPS